MTKGVLPAAEYWLSATLIVITAELLRRAFVKVNDAAETERALNQELRHRVNNSLALALAFASQTKRSAPEPEVFFAAFQSRLKALARAHDILSSGRRGDCQLPHLAKSALEEFVERGAISLTGAHCCVPSASCVPLVLALHELATNAVKHGALSAPGGEVALSWTICNEDARSDVALQWVESGGPPVERPTRKGLGSRLLVRQSGLDEVSLEFAPTGLQCTMVVRGVTGERTTQVVSSPRVMASA
jgi:two-component sensor histidine kinase